MKKLFSRLRVGLEEFQEFLDEKGIGALGPGKKSRLYRFAHFWLMVGKSFRRNRCPARAAALVYTTLLAMIPMFAVVVSVSTGLLKNKGEAGVDRLIDRLVTSIVQPAMVDTNNIPVIVAHAEHPWPWKRTEAAPGTNSPADHAAGVDETNAVPDTAAPASGEVDVRALVSRTIHDLVQRTNTAHWGITGSLLLVLTVIFMLANVEDTFNDIWGIQRGRSWFVRFKTYVFAIVAGSILMALVGSLMSGPHLDATERMLNFLPALGSLVFRLLPFVLLCLGFALFYGLMPNTQVHWSAAIAGGFVGGLLWHMNNLANVVLVSRLVSTSKIYGGLMMVPVFMVGLYFSWLIVLFGAQVAYAYQNRAAYVAEKQTENVNQRGREFVALRLMACIGQRFARGQRPATVPELAAQMALPTRLVQQVLQVLASARLVLEVAGKEMAYAPARPLEQMTCHDILFALRAGQGEDLVTSDGAVQDEVYAEFRRILEAEKSAASSVSVLLMVNRAEALAADRETKAVTEGGKGA